MQTPQMLLQPRPQPQSQGVFVLPTTAGSPALPLVLNAPSQAFSSVPPQSPRPAPVVVLPAQPVAVVPSPQIIIPASAQPWLATNTGSNSQPIAANVPMLSAGDLMSSLANLTRRLGGGPEALHHSAHPVQLEIFGKVVGSLSFKPASILQVRCSIQRCLLKC
jgi:hypothetical protein